MAEQHRDHQPRDHQPRDHQPRDHEPGDDRIRAVLTDAGGWAAQHARLPGPGPARSRARVRSVTTAVAAAAVAAALVVGVVAIATPRADAPSPAAVAPAPGPGPVAPGPPPYPLDRLDLGLRPSGGGETTVRSVDRLPVDVCPAGGLPGAETAIDRRLEIAQGPEYLQGRGVFVFADPDRAATFLAGLGDAAARCGAGTPRTGGGSREIVAGPLSGAWAAGQSFLLVDIPPPGTEPRPTLGTVLLAARRGTAVAVVHASGDYVLGRRPFTLDPNVLAVQRRPLDAIAAQLCHWTAAGC